MAVPVLAFDWSAIDDQELEELVYQIAVGAGGMNVVKRTGPGDKGWDVEAHFLVADPFGAQAKQRWLYEAKHHSSGVSFSALEGNRGAIEVEEPQVFVFAVSSHLTGPCREQLDAWSSKRPATQVQVWERGRLEELTLRHPEVLRWAIGKRLVRAQIDDLLPERPEDSRILTEHEFGVPIRYRLTRQEAAQIRNVIDFLGWCLDCFVDLDNEMTNFELHMGLINWPESLGALALLIELEVTSREYQEALLLGKPGSVVDGLRAQVEECMAALTSYGKTASLVD